MKVMTPTTMSTIRVIELGSLFNKAALAEAIEEQLASGCTAIVVNLENVKMLDSMGLGALVGFSKLLKTQQVGFAVCHLSPTLQKLVTLTKLDRVMTVTPTMEEAIATLSPA
jgi:anti-sigma B factor antagonist